MNRMNVSRETAVMTTTKKDIVQQMSERLEITPAHALRSAEMIFDILADALVEGEYWELRNFGVFKTKERAARMGRNIHTGEDVPIPAYRDLVFKPGREMLCRVNQLSQFTQPKRRDK